MNGVVATSMVNPIIFSFASFRDLMEEDEKKCEYLSLFVFNERGGGGRCAEMKLHFKHWGRSSWALIKYFIPPSLILRFHVPRIFSRQIKRNKKRKRRAPKVAGWRDLWIFERKSRLTNRYFVCWSTKGLLIIYINLRLHFSPPSTKRAPGSRRCVGS